MLEKDSYCDILENLSEGWIIDNTPKEKETVEDFDGGEKAYQKIESHLVLNKFDQKIMLSF